MLTKSLLPLSVLLATASAHFNLNYPTSIGFDEDKEAEFPCGSFDITDRKKVTEFAISGAPIAVLTAHPAVEWEFRAALLNDTSNFKLIAGTVSQKGQGDFCEQVVEVPSEWEGKDGIIQAIQKSSDAEGGFLYQCAAVKFVAATTKPDSAAQSACKNGTRVRIEAAQGTFMLPSSTGTGSSTASSTSTSSSAAGPVVVVTAHVFGAAILVAGLLL